MQWRWLITAGIGIIIGFYWSYAAAGDCNRDCPVSEQDEDGCCAYSEPVATPKPSSATPKPTPRPVTATPKPSCPNGQVITSYTAGHCCWPGQAWNGSACVGEPKCPASMVVEGDSCVSMKTQIDPLVTALEKDFRMFGMAATSTELKAAYTTECSKGWKPACTPDVWSGDLGKAGDYFKPLCSLGDMTACLVTGWARLYTEEEKGIGLTATPTATGTADGEAVLQKACAAGKQVSCAYLGNWLSQKNPPDYTRALSMLQAACDKMDARGCFFLGKLYAYGTGVAQDDSKAVSFYQRSCSGAYGPGCTNLGYMYENGRGVAKDDAQAAELYRKACEGSHSTGCSNLGIMYAFGKGVAQDYSQAISWYKKGCDGGAMPACNNLGSLYENGKGVKQDYVQASSLYGKACAGYYGRACNNLGSLYEGGRGFKQDYAQAFTWYRKACDYDFASGCNSVGYMYELGRSVKQDYAQAAVWYKKGCDSQEMKS